MFDYICMPFLWNALDLHHYTEVHGVILSVSKYAYNNFRVHIYAFNLFIMSHVRRSLLPFIFGQKKEKKSFYRIHQLA